RAGLCVDMRVFPTAGHLASWAGVCRGNNERAGKHRSGRPRPGNRWLRMTLIEAALAASRTSTALGARYRRVMRHRGHHKAVIAVAHAMLVIAYHLLSRETTYHELSADYFDRHQTDRLRRRAVQTLQRQGYRATLEPAASAPHHHLPGVSEQRSRCEAATEGRTR